MPEGPKIIVTRLRISYRIVTVFGFLEERGDERLLGRLHQLDNALVDRVFVLVQPAVRVVADLRQCQQACK